MVGINIERINKKLHGWMENFAGEDLVVKRLEEIERDNPEFGKYLLSQKFLENRRLFKEPPKWSVKSIRCELILPGLWTRFN